MGIAQGFRFDETMSGTYALVESPSQHRPLSFSVEARVPSLWRYLRDHRATLRGTLEAVGFADYVPIEGTMLLAPLSARVIGYEFNFTGNDGKPYRFAGHKTLLLNDLVRSLTELPAEIYSSTGTVVATSTTRFNLRSDLLQFLASWRLTRAS
ncbi:MAG: hypothetical protein MJE77_32885 [Proteobacteria bacterium]|nr:hypothetical protein [Pseudomonadota bacterium]